VGSLFHLPVAVGVPVEQVVSGLRGAGVRILAADGAGDRDLDAELAQTVHPQGLVAVVSSVVGSLDRLPASPRLVCVLVEVGDPGNAGTVLRCADAAGADAVVLTDASVDPYNPKAVRASVGSLFHLPVATGVPVEEAVARLRAAGVRVLAADGAGERDLDRELDEGTLEGPCAWVFGNEAWGLPEETRALADEVVKVPIHGHAESLNLATAAAVCLYASARAQRSHSGCRAEGPAR
jgi:TrmH family RNA methyltransferase